MRNVFDHYSQAENQLTHALFTALDNDRNLLGSFVKEVCNSKHPKPSKLHLSVQRYPFSKHYDEAKIDDRNIPDAWIFDDEGFALVFEAKITATLTHAQLVGHQRVSAKQGFDDVTFFTIVADSNAGVFDGWNALSWSNIYLWLRDKSSGSAWAKQAADYFEILEARMLEQGKLGNAEITTFDGFSAHEDGYSYLVAKSELRKAMQELRKDTDLVDTLGMDPSNLGRGAITGKSEQRVWDYLAINSGFETANFTDFMHLTLGLHFDGVEAMVTVPNGLATQPKNALKALGLDGFRAICFEVLENLKPRLDDEPNAVPTMRSVQRRYPSQRSVPFLDAELEFDLRTAFNAGHPTKHQPQWLDALYDVFANKRSNCQFQIGVVFKHSSCESMKSTNSLKLLSKSWIACEPLISAAKVAQA
ncbi:MAG: hypothetical protein ACSHWS_10905 [Sulfitobacter sp.]